MIEIESGRKYLFTVSYSEGIVGRYNDKDVFVLIKDGNRFYNPRLLFNIYDYDFSIISKIDSIEDNDTFIFLYSSDTYMNI